MVARAVSTRAVWGGKGSFTDYNAKELESVPLK